MSLAESPVDASRIHEMTAGDPEFLEEIVGMYVDDSKGLIRELWSAVQSADAHALKVNAHKLKGSSLNMGANQVASLAKNLEEMGRSGDCATGAHILAELEREFGRAKQAFEQMARGAA